MRQRRLFLATLELHGPLRNGTLSDMSTKLIEQQLTDLQRRVASLEAAVKTRPRDAWKQIIGISKGQPLDREAARLGAEWRAKENKRK